MQRILTVLVVFLLVFGSPARLLLAADYFVNVGTGSDTNDGLSPTVAGAGVGPFKTITQALSVAGDGDTVMVAAGVYSPANETFPLQMPDGVALLGAGSGPSGTVVDLMALTSPPFLVGKTGSPTTISGMRVLAGSTAVAAIKVEGFQADLQILDNYLSGGSDGIAATAGCDPWPVTSVDYRLTVRDNVVEGFLDTGISVRLPATLPPGQEIVIQGNSLAGGSGQGIDVHLGAVTPPDAWSGFLGGTASVFVDLQVSDNLVSGPAGAGIDVSFLAANAGVRQIVDLDLISNLVTLPGGAGIRCSGLAARGGVLDLAVLAESNLVESASGQGLQFDVGVTVNLEAPGVGPPLAQGTMTGLFQYNSLLGCFDTGMSIRAVALSGGTASADVAVKFNHLASNLGNGLYLGETVVTSGIAALSAAVEGNLITANLEDGVHLAQIGVPLNLTGDFGGGAAVLNGRNTIKSNAGDYTNSGYYDFRNDQPDDVFAERNWWGSTDTAVIAGHILDSTDPPLVGGPRGAVLFDPPLEDPADYGVLPNPIPNVVGQPVRLSSRDLSAFVERCGSLLDPDHPALQIVLGGRAVRNTRVEEDTGLVRGSGGRAFFNVPPGVAAGGAVLKVTNPGGLVPPARTVGMAATTNRSKTLICFLATAAYGDEDAPELRLLRRWRDECLAQNALGRQCVKAYYALSPPLAAAVAESPAARSLTRAALAPVLGAVKLWLEMPWLCGMAAAGLLLGLLRRRGA